MTCSFFGCNKYSFELFYFVRKTAKDLIENHDVDTFYICQQGTLDRTAVAVLDHLRLYTHPHIKMKYALPNEQGTKDLQAFTRLAQLEYDKNMPPHKAIAKRYIGMLQTMDFVIVSCQNKEVLPLLSELAKNYKAQLCFVDEQ